MQKVGGRYQKCGRSNYQVKDSKPPLRVQTPVFPSIINQELVLKKRKFDKEHPKITELS